MIKKLFVAAAIAAAGFAAVPASAQISGTGKCSGLSINSAWLDWGTGYVRANVYNHNGDNSTAKDLKFRVKSTEWNKKSTSTTIQSRQSVDVNVFHWTSTTGKQNSEFPSDPYGYYITGMKLTLTNCGTP